MHRSRPHRSQKVRLVLFVVVLSTTTAAQPFGPLHAAAQATGDQRLSWDPSYRESGALVYGIAGALTVGAILSRILWQPLEPRFVAENALDRGASHLLSEVPTRRRRLRIAGRILALGAMLQTELVDPSFVVWAGDRNRDVAGEIYALNGLSLAATSLVASLLAPGARRGRPFYRRCADEPEYDPGCGEPTQARSLVDGRFALAVTSAALTCTHHAHLPLYGSSAADAAACAGAVAMAATSGLFAWLADQQHPTDLLLGVILGVASGFVLPKAVGYGF